MSRSAWTTLSMLGPADLQRDGAAVVEHRPVDLRDRRRGHRLGVERREDLAQGAAVVLGEDRLDLAERERPDVVAEGGELGRVGLGEEVGPGAERPGRA